MNKLFTKIATACVGLAMAVGVGVAIGHGSEVREARADEVYKTVLFGRDYNSKGVSGYSGVDFSSTNDGFTVDTVNCNNNNTTKNSSNNWTYIKIGGKNGAYTGTITTHDAIDEAITRVDMTIDAFNTASDVTSMTLYTSSNNSSWSSAGTFNKTTGVKSVTLSSPAANLYYKIEVVCKKATSNGVVTISKIEYYKAVSEVDTTVLELDDTPDYESGASANDFYVGQYFDIGATLSTGSTSKVVWSVDSSSVGATATIVPSEDTKSARVTATNSGSLVIKAQAVKSDGETVIANVYDTYSVTVKAAVSVSSVTLDAHSASINKGETTTLNATVLPANAANKTVVWESSDESVATVASTVNGVGVVTGVAGGTATITAKSQADNTKYDECEVTVAGPLYSFYSLASFDNLTTTYNSQTVYTDKELTHTVSSTAYKWQASSFEWWTYSGTQTCLGDYSTSNGAWATFSGLDSFTNISKALTDNEIGSNTRTYSMFTKSFGVVRPTKAVFGCTGIKSDTTAANGNNLYLLGSNDNGVTWEILSDAHPSGSSIGTSVEQSATWNNSSKYTTNATVLFALVFISTSSTSNNNAPHIRNPYFEVYGESLDSSATWNAGKISITSESSHVEVGGDLTLSVSKKPSFASNPTVTWTSSDATIASVGQSTGVVHGESTGTATITATTGDGVTATLLVTVDAATVHVTGVELDESALTIPQAGHETLAATVSPSTATDKSVAWTISGDSDISVDENGKVSVASTATVGDTATVTVTTTDGGFTATCAITVSAFEGDYHKIMDSKEIHAGMVLTFGSAAKNAVADGFSSKMITASENNATIINGNLCADTVLEFTVSGKVGAWVLTDSDGNWLGQTSATKTNLTLNQTTTHKTWNITISEGVASVVNTDYTTSPIYFNSGSPRFTNYESAQAAFELYAADSDDNVLTFIRNNMRMGDTALNTEEDTGACKAGGSNYYLTAKAALADLSQQERDDFENDAGSKYTEALNRYKKWAKACKDGDPFDGETTIVTSLQTTVNFRISKDTTDVTIVIVVISAISTLAVGGFFFIRKKKIIK